MSTDITTTRPRNLLINIFLLLSIPDYIEGIIDEILETLQKQSSSTPAGNHVFHTNPSVVKLDDANAATLHHLIAKLFYQCCWTFPDLQTTSGFLTTGIQALGINDLMIVEFWGLPP